MAVVLSALWLILVATVVPAMAQEGPVVDLRVGGIILVDEPVGAGGPAGDLHAVLPVGLGGYFGGGLLIGSDVTLTYGRVGTFFDVYRGFTLRGGYIRLWTEDGGGGSSTFGIGLDLQKFSVAVDFLVGRDYFEARYPLITGNYRIVF